MAQIEVSSLLRELVAIPSVSSVSQAFDQSNKGVIDAIATFFERIDCDLKVLCVNEQKQKYDLIAKIGDGEGGLVLSGHSDTVPCDKGDWESDPFSLTENDGRLYGLGAADMKGFVAVCMAVAARVDAKRLKRPLYIVATADEESSMDGARLLADMNEPKAEYCIIGEPTDLVPITRHKGVMMEALQIEGGAGHASDPDSAPNAIDGLGRVVIALNRWRDQLKTRYPAPEFAVPYPTVNFGHVHGGDNPNRICAHAELHVDLRPVPGIDLELLRSEMEQQAAEALEGTGCRVARRPLFRGIEPFANLGEGLLVPLVERLSGHQANSVSFGTEAGFFAALGMETVVWGPGRISEAHQPNEYIECDQLRRAEVMLEQVVCQLLYA